MAAAPIPKALAALIAKTWPDGVVVGFDTEESDFPNIAAKLERDLSRIRGARLEWQTEPEEPVDWDEDLDGEPPTDRHFQSYHLFFVAPTATNTVSRPKD
jgi:hypothetical protein